MSYSYIKSVFPNFTPEKDKTLPVYNQLSQLRPQKSEKDPMAYNDQELTQFVKELLSKKSSGILQETPSTQSLEKTKDNLRFYNLPAPTEFIEKNKQPIQHPYCMPQAVESFDNTELSCNTFTEHVFKCEKCKTLLMKQWNLDNTKRRNEEIMEIITFIIFGVFVLLLIENLKK